jgi:hypothetical protein
MLIAWFFISGASMTLLNKSRAHFLLVSAACLGSLTGLSSSALSASYKGFESTQPIAGTYYNTSTFTSVAGCPDGVFSVGQTGTGYFTNPGPGNKGATARIVASSTSGSVVTVIAYAGKMPAAGVTSWSGSGVDTDEPAGDSHALTFKATFTFVDSRSFLAQQTIHWKIAGFPNCTTKSTQASVYTGM